ncbi:MAG TPA: aa3-type cytochrome c oxidase subunit IV [Alphaproteobacteria bacterium]|nr:aa3-type cytochrome c oxidase subunit IV [Alphaproteobacteria bacterium]
MAKKPAAAKADDVPAMDYAQHEAMWKAWTTMVKWAIVASGFILVALYCFIQANQPVLGTLLLLVLPVGAVVLLVSRSRSAA